MTVKIYIKSRDKIQNYEIKKKITFMRSQL